MLCERSWCGVSCFGVFFDYVGPCNDTLCKYQARYTDCGDDAFNEDIAGNGVVFAFIISVLVTTVAAICATTIDHYTGSEHALLPLVLRKRSSPHAEQKRQERVNLWRNVLGRLILAFADQQLVTGFALLTGAWIKLSGKPSYLPQGRNWPYYWLPSSSFALVVFLCCGSSSAHLACLLVLRNYFVEHKITARVRLVLFVLFSLFLTVTIALASSFTAYFLAMVSYVYDGLMGSPSLTATRVAQAFVFLLPLLTMFWIFWICSLQLFPTRKALWRTWLATRIVNPVRRSIGVNWLWRKRTGWMKDTHRMRLARWIKASFWTIVLGDPLLVFALQILLATLSVVWILLQRFAALPTSYYHSNFMQSNSNIRVCSLRDAAKDDSYDPWSLGQTLPVFLLALPVLSAWETYVEECQSLRKGIDVSGTTRPQAVAQSEQELTLISRDDNDNHDRNDSEDVRTPSPVMISRSKTHYDADDTPYRGTIPQRAGMEGPVRRDTYHSPTDT